MNRQSDLAIVLSRIDFGEKDRILTLLCKKAGKIRVLAKSVRSDKSKLAGGIELFSESQVDFVEGKSGLFVLTSSRLKEHFDGIVGDLDKTMIGYENLKLIDKITEDKSGQEYYGILRAFLFSLSKDELSKNLVKLWLSLQILKVSGHSPNLSQDENGENLNLAESYTFNLDKQCFTPRESGRYTASQIKLMRLLMSRNYVPNININDDSIKQLNELANRLLNNHVLR